MIELRADGVKPSHPLRVLVVCTANVCRSPVVERLVRRALAAHSIAAAVTSAGTHGGHNVVHPSTVAAAAEAKIDLSNHRPRLLDATLIARDGADLIITMTRQHLERVVELEPSAFARTFTLPELAALASDHGVDPVTHNVTTWLEAISSDRSPGDVTAGGDAYDVDDPYGAPRILHRRMVQQVDHFVDSIVPLLAASVDPVEY